MISNMDEMDDATAAQLVLNSHTVENNFKIARVLAIQGNEEHALSKFKDVCLSLEEIVKHNPSATVELHFLPLSLGEMATIFKKRQDLNKALAFMQAERKFLEYMASNQPHHEDEHSGDGTEDIQLEEHKLPDLFTEMHKIFKMPNAEPPQDPQDIAKLFMEAKEKQDQETVKKNLEMLNRISKERQEKLANSRWERFLEYVNDHPIRVALGAVAFLAIFLIVTLMSISFDDVDPGKDSRALRQKAAEKHGIKLEDDTKNGKRKMPQMDPEQLKQMQDLMKKLQNDIGTSNPGEKPPEQDHHHHDLGSNKEEMEELLAKMKKQLEDTQGKAQPEL